MVVEGRGGSGWSGAGCARIVPPWPILRRAVCWCSAWTQRCVLVPTQTMAAEEWAQVIRVRRAQVRYEERDLPDGETDALGAMVVCVQATGRVWRDDCWSNLYAKPHRVSLKFASNRADDPIGTGHTVTFVYRLWWKILAENARNRMFNSFNTCFFSLTSILNYLRFTGRQVFQCNRYFILCPKFSCCSLP